MESENGISLQQGLDLGHETSGADQTCILRREARDERRETASEQCQQPMSVKGECVIELSEKAKREERAATASGLFFLFGTAPTQQGQPSLATAARLCRTHQGGTVHAMTALTGGLFSLRPSAAWSVRQTGWNFRKLPRQPTRQKERRSVRVPHLEFRNICSCKIATRIEMWRRRDELSRNSCLPFQLSGAMGDCVTA